MIQSVVNGEEPEYSLSAGVSVNRLKHNLKLWLHQLKLSTCIPYAVFPLPDIYPGEILNLLKVCTSISNRSQINCDTLLLSILSILEILTIKGNEYTTTAHSDGDDSHSPHAEEEKPDTNKSILDEFI